MYFHRNHPTSTKGTMRITLQGDDNNGRQMVRQTQMALCNHGMKPQMGTSDGNALFECHSVHTLKLYKCSK